MTYSNVVKNGFKLIYKNWQLVPIQFGMMLVNGIGFFVFVGIPLAVAFVIFGLDFTEMTELKNLMGTMRDPSEIITKYIGLIVVLLVSFIVYLLVATAVGLYVFGGSAGIIGRAVKDGVKRFNKNMFFSEGKRLFWPLVGFTAIIGIIFLGVAFVIGVFAGGIGIIISIAKGYETTLAVVLGIFFSLLLFCIGFALIISSIALALYGTAVIVLKGTGPWQATKDTIKYLYRNPAALWLYCLAFGGYFLATFLLILLGTPFNLIPIVGTIIAIPYQIFSYALQSYLGLVIVAVIFIYYYSTEVKPSETLPPLLADEGTEPISGNSTPLSDTSQNQTPEPKAPLPEKG
ncbi:MAG: hypothetical protein A2X54_08595 [Nitrospirae bacterium GWF2_44_13]|nr:MAG: hypothetical protein A2X54_08595 [Nitrospirae bacterium GWF2_44_13]OGW64181.1 MAG: hypothetical protein A2222_00130 [Nitrospirae bacterium RIFOXYA2_FULL_44_9]OGW72097.1 MAG: hypothetical protein A2484_07080 [Nitrospirae bacterium RIFOXYC2_FULL_44_7]HBG92852.1 hypothetical protein [Nitrospiraceae bacterium]